MTALEAAHELGVSRTTVWRMVRAGELRGVRRRQSPGRKPQLDVDAESVRARLGNVRRPVVAKQVDLLRRSVCELERRVRELEGTRTKGRLR